MCGKKNKMADVRPSSDSTDRDFLGVSRSYSTWCFRGMSGRMESNRGSRFGSLTTSFRSPTSTGKSMDLRGLAQVDTGDARYPPITRDKSCSIQGPGGHGNPTSTLQLTGSFCHCHQRQTKHIGGTHCQRWLLQKCQQGN